MAFESVTYVEAPSDIARQALLNGWSEVTTPSYFRYRELLDRWKMWPVVRFDQTDRNLRVAQTCFEFWRRQITPFAAPP